MSISPIYRTFWLTCLKKKKKRKLRLHFCTYIYFYLISFFPLVSRIHKWKYILYDAVSSHFFAGSFYFGFFFLITFLFRFFFFLCINRRYFDPSYYFLFGYMTEHEAQLVIRFLFFFWFVLHKNRQSYLTNISLLQMYAYTFKYNERKIVPYSRT